MKITISDAHGNEVTVEGDGTTTFSQAENAAKRLFDHVKAAPPSPGPGGAGQFISLRYTDSHVAYFREGDPLSVKAGLEDSRSVQ